MRRWQFMLSTAAATIVLASLASDRLSAQTTQTEYGSFINRMGAIERDLRAVEHRVYGSSRSNMLVADARGITAATGTPNIDQQSADRLMQRVDGLEQEVRNLTDQVEQLGNKLDRLQTQFDQFSGKPAPGGAAGGPTPLLQGGNSGAPISGNSAQGTGLAPESGTIGQVPTGSVASIGNYQDQYNRALGYLRQQNYKSAEAALKNFLAQHGDTDLAGPAMFWLGETYFVENDFTNAAQTFVDSLKKYPESPKAPDSMLKLGMSLGALNQKAQACATFSELLKKFPDASVTITQRAKVERQRNGCKS